MSFAFNGFGLNKIDAPIGGSQEALGDNKSAQAKSALSVTLSIPATASQIIDAAEGKAYVSELGARNVVIVDEKKSLNAIYAQALRGNLKAGYLLDSSPRDPKQIRLLAAQFDKHANDFSQKSHVLSAPLLRLADLQERLLSYPSSSELNFKSVFVGAILDMLMFKDMCAGDIRTACVDSIPELNNDALDLLDECLAEVAKAEKELGFEKIETQLEMIEGQLDGLERCIERLLNQSADARSSNNSRPSLDELINKFMRVELVINVPQEVRARGEEFIAFGLSRIANFVPKKAELPHPDSINVYNLDTKTAYEHYMLINIFRIIGAEIDTQE